jgi:hypothetical protein
MIELQMVEADVVKGAITVKKNINVERERYLPQTAFIIPVSLADSSSCATLHPHKLHDES